MYFCMTICDVYALSYYSLNYLLIVLHDDNLTVPKRRKLQYLGYSTRDLSFAFPVLRIAQNDKSSHINGSGYK